MRAEARGGAISNMVLSSMLSLGPRPLLALVLSRLRRSRLLWPLWWSLTGAALSAAALGVMAWRQQVDALDAARSDLDAAQGAAAAAAAKDKPVAPADFTSSLPAMAPMDKMLRTTFQVAGDVGVTVVSADPQDAVAATVPNGLAHATLSLRLAGPYGGIKAVLAELLARFPGLTVQQLRIHHAAGDGRQEAVLKLQQWLRPVPPTQPSVLKGS